MAVPKTLFDVQRETNTNMQSRVLGYRGVQVLSFVKERLESGQPFPSLGELKRELDFYDKAGALRALRRVQQRTALNNNP